MYFIRKYYPGTVWQSLLKQALSTVARLPLQVQRMLFIRHARAGMRLARKP
jgi:hypothetical protein